LTILSLLAHTEFLQKQNRSAFQSGNQEIVDVFNFGLKAVARKGESLQETAQEEG
jgi:hypothetical protein